LKIAQTGSGILKM